MKTNRNVVWMHKHTIFKIMTECVMSIDLLCHLFENLFVKCSKMDARVNSR